jgi:hypothetical protein
MTHRGTVLVTNGTFRGKRSAGNAIAEKNSTFNIGGHDMISQHDFSLVEALDLDSIKVKLMHTKSGEGWSLARANAVELEYRRFLYLMKTYPNEHTSPLVDVDTFWHYHILDTKKYAADCQQVFGYFLHHFPYVGMRGNEDEQALQRMGERMRTLYENTFGEEYLRHTAAGQAAQTSRSAGLSLAAMYGGKASAEAAYCTRAIAESAYCTREVAEPAYCTRAIPEPAYCTRELAEPAYCTRAIDATPVDESPQPVTQQHAQRDTSEPRAPEDRIGFYLERPRLPAA